MCAFGVLVIFSKWTSKMSALVSILCTDLTPLMSLSPPNKKCVLNYLFGYLPRPIEIIQTTKIVTITIDKSYRILQMCLLACGMQTSNNIIHTHNRCCEWYHVLTKLYVNIRHIYTYQLDALYMRHACIFAHTHNLSLSICKSYDLPFNYCF